MPREKGKRSRQTGREALESKKQETGEKKTKKSWTKRNEKYNELDVTREGREYTDLTSRLLESLLPRSWSRSWLLLWSMGKEGEEERLGKGWVGYGAVLNGGRWRCQTARL